MENQTFIEFIVEMVANETFLKQSEEHKKYIYGLLEESYEMRVQSRYDAGHHQGWLDGMRRANEIINNK